MRLPFQPAFFGSRHCFRLANDNWRTLVLWLLGLDFVTEVPFRLHPFVVSSFSNLSSSPEATGPLAFASAPDFSAPFVVSIRPLNLQQFSAFVSNMSHNQFAALKEEAGSPMSSVFSVSDPNDLDVSMEIAKPEEGWMDIQSWTSPQDNQSLDDRRVEFARFESTLSKVESDLGFDEGMAAMRPEDVLRSTAHIAEDSTGYPSSDTGGRVLFTQILSQLIDRSQDFLGARTVYLIVDSRLPHSVDYWPAFQPWWASREQLVGPHKEVTRMVWYHINDQSGVQYVPHTWAGVFVLLVARFLFPSINIALVVIRIAYRSHFSK